MSVEYIRHVGESPPGVLDLDMRHLPVGKTPMRGYNHASPMLQGILDIFEPVMLRAGNRHEQAVGRHLPGVIGNS